MSGGLGSVEIGAQAIYDKLVNVEQAVGSIDGKLDRHGDRLDIHDERIDDHETRLRVIEQRRNFTPAQIASLLLAAAAVVVAVLALFIQH